MLSESGSRQGRWKMFSGSGLRCRPARFMVVQAGTQTQFGRAHDSDRALLSERAYESMGISQTVSVAFTCGAGIADCELVWGIGVDRRGAMTIKWVAGGRDVYGDNGADRMKASAGTGEWLTLSLYHSPVCALCRGGSFGSEKGGNDNG